MTEIRLKRLLSERKKAAAILADLAEMNNLTLGIEDVEGKVLLGVAGDDTLAKYPITCEGTVIGWVVGPEQAAPIAGLIGHLAENEVEKNTLADGMLEHYRELNLLYNLSEKLVASLEVVAVAQTALDEASRLIQATGGCVILQDDRQETLNLVATFGQGVQSQGNITSREGLIGHLIQNSKGEIVNDVHADARYVDSQGFNAISSLVCAPFKTKDKVLGLIVLINDVPITYTAKDLKLLNAVASQTTPAVENALIYEKTFREAREREERLHMQLRQLQIDLGQDDRLLRETFDNTPPFDFLTADEKKWLAAQAQTFSYPDGWLISGPDSTDYDRLFLVLQGRVAIQDMDQTIQGYIEGPAYFGERSIFLEQTSTVQFVAKGVIQIVILAGRDIRRLTAQNSMFRHAFATALRTKQRIFYGYEAFVNLLLAQVDEGFIRLRDLVRAYRNLNPLLHPGNMQNELDFNALGYIMPRLPESITSALTIHLAEYLPMMVHPVRDALHSASQRAKKRDFYNILPNKTIMLLRDRTTDTVDLLTKLCIYAVETGKIQDRLSNTPTAMELARYVIQGGTPEEARQIITALPFTPQEIGHLEGIFGDKLLQRLYEIMAQAGDLSIYVQKTDHRYAKTASELWLGQIRQGLWQILTPQEFNDELDVHIISSNTHSVYNCLSTWLNQQAEQILSWAAEQLPASRNLTIPADRLYFAARAWFQAHPRAVTQRLEADQEQGIYILDDPSFSGIKVGLIDANRLGQAIDPYLGCPNFYRRTLLVNIDYAYGQQAELIMRSLVLLFGHRIRSMSILGKSGAIVGQRGELLLPDHLLLQTDDQLYPIPNRDLSLADFAAVDCRLPIHEGTLLTVLGTIMQSREMFYYYRHFWNVIGMEMEGSYYLREILRSRSLGLIPKEVSLRFAYYTSDTPLEPGASLASSLSPAEGVPAVYGITRAVLRRVLKSSECVGDGTSRNP